MGDYTTDNIYGVAVERVGTCFALSRGPDFRSMCLPIVVSPFAPPAAVSAYASHIFAAAARGESFTFPVAPEVAASVIYVRDVTLGILRLVEAPEEPLSRHVYNRHGFVASAADLAQWPRNGCPASRYRFEPDELGHADRRRVTVGLCRRQGWQPQFDLAATADDLLSQV